MLARYSRTYRSGFSQREGTAGCPRKDMLRASPDVKMSIFKEKVSAERNNVNEINVTVLVRIPYVNRG